MKDAHQITCREWFEFLETGQPSEFRDIVYELPNMDITAQAVWLEAVHHDTVAVSNILQTGKVRLSLADKAFNEYFKTLPLNSRITLNVFTPKKDAEDLAQEKLVKLLKFKNEYLSLNHIASEFPDYAEFISAFAFMFFDIKPVEIKINERTAITLRRNYSELWAWLLDRTILFAPDKFNKSDGKRNYYMEFYSVKNAMQADISIDKTSIFEYNVLCGILAKRNEAESLQNKK